MEESKPVMKSLFERHIVETEKGKQFNYKTFVAECEAKFDTLQMKIDNLNKGMEFFVEWFEREEEAKKPKLILPDQQIVRPL